MNNETILNTVLMLGVVSRDNAILLAKFLDKSGSITPTSGWFIASANKQNPENQSYLSASWSALQNPSPALFQTPFDDNLNFDANVSVLPQSASLNNASVINDLSAPMSSSIYILAVQ